MDVGKPFDFVESGIFDENGQESPLGEVGEIGIRGVGLFSGYLGHNTINKNHLDQNYFMTGDLGYKDDEDNYFFVDRKKDLIIKGGVNIVPSEIERVMYSHPLVEEAAVIGKPDIYLGETIQCYIVPKSEAVIDIDELTAFCKTQLGTMKTPSTFVCVESALVII